jgi:hypothetical protein
MGKSISLLFTCAMDADFEDVKPYVKQRTLALKSSFHSILAYVFHIFAEKGFLVSNNFLKVLILEGHAQGTRLEDVIPSSLRSDRRPLTLCWFLGEALS